MGSLMKVFSSSLSFYNSNIIDTLVVRSIGAILDKVDSLHNVEIFGDKIEKGSLDTREDVLNRVTTDASNLDKETFEKFKDCYDELYKIACEDAFVKGFSLASKMLSEALS